MLNEKFIKELFGENSMTIKEIKEKGNLQETPQKISGFLRQQDYIRSVGKKDNRLIYKVVSVVKATGKVEKVKNIFRIELDNNSYLEYDFNKKDFLNNDIFKINNNIIYPKEKNNLVLRLFLEKRYENFREIEWLYNYIDLLDESIFHTNPRELEKCPKGYVNWLKEEHKNINSDSLKEYKIITEYTDIPRQLLNNFMDWHFNNIESYKILNDLCKNNLKRIIRNSVDNFEFNIDNDLFQLIRVLYNFQEKENYLQYLDTNRTLKDNYENYDMLYQKNKYKFLEENLHKLNFLNNKEIKNYIIIVPQEIKDLINEGKQQNNCVGYYYNDSISRGENLIYFLRDKSNPSKSLVTCRYNLISKSTVEHRIKNNLPATQGQDKIIKEIDEIIKNNLAS